MILKMNEQEKYENIKQTLEGKISKRRCSIKLYPYPKTILFETKNIQHLTGCQIKMFCFNN